MDSEKEAYIKGIIEDIKKIEYIKSEDIPNIELYMDQVTTFMDSRLAGFKRYDADKMLTKTMINNYTKNNLLPSPNKKKYSKDHMIILIFIYYMKSVMTIEDIHSLIEPLNDKYFGADSGVKFSDIYDEIFKLEETQAEVVARDVIKNFERSKEAFAMLEDGSEKEQLQMFANICMLSFDVYMKKQLIEKMIEDNFSLKDKKEEKKKDKEKKDKKDKED